MISEWPWGIGPPQSGDEVDATPHLTLPSGLYRANCVSRRRDAEQERGQTAAIALKSPAGAALDRAVSGFA